MPARPQLRIVPAQKPVSDLDLTIREFLLAKRQEQCSPLTIEKYTIRLTQFAAWIATEGNTSSLGDLSKVLLRQWGASLNPNWQPATTRHVITIVKGFLNWCSAEGLIDEQLARALRLPKARRRIQRTLSSDEVKRLIDACDTSMFGLRDVAIVSLMVDSGLRNAELRRVVPSDLVFDFPFDEKRVNFVRTTGKGGDQESVPFGSDTAARLRAWLKVRVAKPGVKEVFVSLGGRTPLRPLTRTGLSKLLEELGARAGVPDVTPHSLRRTFALLLDEAGHTTRQIQLLGRWSDIKMVERYTQALRAGKNYQSPVDRLNNKR